MLVVIHRDIRINAIVVGIMVSLAFIMGHLKKEVKIKPNYVTNVDKKRKTKSLELVLESDQHSNPKLSLLASNSCLENPNLGDEETSQANPTAHEVCIDGWAITYKEFQPRRFNQFRKKVNQGQRADNTRSNTLVENDITKDLVKRKCYHHR